jgi:hypothetical protein
MWLPMMLTTSALYLPHHHSCQTIWQPGIAVGVGRGGNHLVPSQGCVGGGSFVPTQMRWWYIECEHQSAAEGCREGKEYRQSAFRLFCFELCAAASSTFQNKQQRLLLCLWARIPPREHLVCPRIQCTWSSLLKLSAWTFSLSLSQYASIARTAVLIQVWYGTPTSYPVTVWLNMSSLSLW